jgi:hypothetical protein
MSEAAGPELWGGAFRQSPDRGQRCGGNELRSKGSSQAARHRRHSARCARPVVRPDAHEHNCDPYNRAHTGGDQRRGAAGCPEPVGAAGCSETRGLGEFGRGLDGSGCPQCGLNRARILSPEVLGGRGKGRIGAEPGVGRGSIARSCADAQADRHQLVPRAEPIARKLQHVALVSSVVPAVLWLPTFRFHGVCRPFLAGRADYILSSR